MGMVNAVVAARRARGDGARVGRGDQRQEPDRAAHAEVRVQPVDDGLVGQQLFAGEATRLAYGTDEGAEGRDAFLEKRQPDWSPFPCHY